MPARTFQYSWYSDNYNARSKKQRIDGYNSGDIGRRIRSIEKTISFVSRNRNEWTNYITYIPSVKSEGQAQRYILRAILQHVTHVTLVQRWTGHLFHISLRKNLECARLSNHCDFFASRSVQVVTGVWQVRMACAMPVCVLFVFHVGYRF